MRYPHTKAKGLTVGSVKSGSKVTQQIAPLRDVDDAFINLDRVSYMRRRFLIEAGIKPRNGSRDGPFLELLRLQDSVRSIATAGGGGSSEKQTSTEVPGGNVPLGGLDLQRASFLASDFAVVLQTPWQRDLFCFGEGEAATDVPETDVESGHAGVLTDVTFRVFESYFLCTSSVFSVALSRWVPIMWTVLRNQKEEDFAQHFLSLFQCLSMAGLSREDVEQKMASVVDFSLAQKNGFKQAYARWRSQYSPLSQLSQAAKDAEMASFEAHAGSLLKGCLFHFHQSVKRVRNNGNFVPVAKQDEFLLLIKKTLNPKTSEDALYTTFAVILEKFPNCREWLTWCLQCDTASMIFPSITVMGDQRWNKLPTSISALENLHSIYYMCWEVKMDLISGLQCLQGLAELFEAEHSAEESGATTRYRVKQPKAVASKPKRGVRKYDNDGRAPDSNQHLKKKQKAEVSVKGQNVLSLECLFVAFLFLIMPNCFLHSDPPRPRPRGPEQRRLVFNSDSPKKAGSGVLVCRQQETVRGMCISCDAGGGVGFWATAL